MGGIARTVEDVILGEAKAGSFEDMVAVASAIANRAAALNVSPQDVVANRTEFNAFGRALPDGADKHREMARQALNYVETVGPVHTGQFYATPKAADNLPDGLAEVARTDGHVYYSDPQGRAINTAVGYRQPATQELSYAPATPSLPTYDSLMANVGQPMDFSPPPGAIRDMPVQPALASVVETAVGRLGPEYGWTTTSAGQPARGMQGVSRTGSTRHNDGWAVDGSLTRDGQRLDPTNDYQAYMDVMTNLAEEGAGGLGHYGWGIHADLKTPNAWGPTTSARSLDPGFAEAIGQGRALSSLAGNYPTPTARPDTALGQPAMVANAPTEPAQAAAPQTSLLTAYAEPEQPVTIANQPTSLLNAYSKPDIARNSFDMQRSPTAAPSLLNMSPEEALAMDVQEQRAKDKAMADLRAGLQAQAASPMPQMGPQQPTGPVRGDRPGFDAQRFAAPPMAAPVEVAPAPQVASVPQPSVEMGDMAGPRAGIASAPVTASVNGITFDDATRAAAARSGEVNSLLGDVQGIRGRNAALGGILGLVAGGPVGGILGLALANKMTNNSRQAQALGAFPSAASYRTGIDDRNLAQKIAQMFGQDPGNGGYEGLSDIGRETYESSGQFSDAVDSGRAGLW